jgi:hypothetical protein
MNARTAKPCGPGRRRYGQAFAEVHGAQPGEMHCEFARRGRPEGIRLPGERGISRRTTAQGRPCVRLHLYAAVHFSLRYTRTADRGCQSAPGLPCALCLKEGARDEAKLGWDQPRGCGGMSAIQIRSGERATVSPTSSRRRPGPITTGNGLAMTGGSVRRLFAIDRSRGMGPGFRRDDTESAAGSVPKLPVGSRTPAARTDARPARS